MLRSCISDYAYQHIINFAVLCSKRDKSFPKKPHIWRLQIDIESEFRKAKISMGTARNAKKKMGIVTVKKHGDKRWWWSLVDQDHSKEEEDF